MSLTIPSVGVTWNATDRILYKDKAWKLIRFHNLLQFGYCQVLAVLTGEQWIYGIGLLPLSCSDDQKPYPEFPELSQ